LPPPGHQGFRDEPPFYALSRLLRFLITLSPLLSASAVPPRDPAPMLNAGVSWLNMRYKNTSKYVLRLQDINFIAGET